MDRCHDMNDGIILMVMATKDLILMVRITKDLILMGRVANDLDLIMVFLILTLFFAILWCP